MSTRTHFLAPLLEPAGPRYLLRNLRTGAVVASHLETAFDPEARRKGLLGRHSLAPGTVLVIAPCNGVHTFFMKFSIDVVFVDRSGRVLKWHTGLRPWRIGFSMPAFAVFEFAADTVSRSNLQVGDRLVLDRAVDGD